MRKLLLLENCFSVRYERMILKQRRLVNELVKAYTESVLRPPCCSLNDFYCQNIQGQFFPASIAVFLVKIVQNINRALYFVIRKLFLLENCFSLRYERMNIETKGIG